jgi:ABC-type multidrug transport system permease subunit
MPLRTLICKEFRLLLRDPWSALLLLVMPLLFILILGLLLGEGFGQKTDDRTRIVIVDLDAGAGELGTAVPGQRRWADQVRDDMKNTSGLRVETLSSVEEARRLVEEHRLPAVLVLKPGFTQKVNSCGFLRNNLNPFERDGVRFDAIDTELIRDERQVGQVAVIAQVAQVTLLRVILPYMIGRAFQHLADPEFIQVLGEEVYVPIPEALGLVFSGLKRKRDYKVSAPALEKLRQNQIPADVLKKLQPLKDETFSSKESLQTRLAEVLSGEEPRRFDNAILSACREDTVSLNELLQFAAGGGNPELAAVRKLDYQERVGKGVQGAIHDQFEKYDLTGMTWKALTKSTQQGAGGEVKDYVEAGGNGLLKRGAYRYQILVPAYTVMFSFFLVLTAGWIFVSERRQGTLRRMQLAPITRAEVLLGKLVPCFVLSVGQGILLLVAGKLVFGMRWGPDRWTLAEQMAALTPVVLSTSLAAMGLAVMIASWTRTEMQVALFGAVPVLVLAIIGGCVLPREMMPEQTQNVTLLSPHGWALDAYAELLDPNPRSNPNIGVILRACGVLTAFGLGMTALAWWRLRLE